MIGGLILLVAPRVVVQRGDIGPLNLVSSLRRLVVVWRSSEVGRGTGGSRGRPLAGCSFSRCTLSKCPFAQRGYGNFVTTLGGSDGMKNQSRPLVSSRNYKGVTSSRIRDETFF